jgi:hypothetical protein
MAENAAMVELTSHHLLHNTTIISEKKKYYFFKSFFKVKSNFNPDIRYLTDISDTMLNIAYPNTQYSILSPSI